MVKRHMKRMSAPQTWPINRKKNVFIARPHPGAHPQYEGMSLGSVVKEILNLATTAREVRSILFNTEVLLDGRRRKDARTQVGLFDVLSFKATNKHYRIIYNKEGKLDAVEIPAKEATLKPSKVMNKTMAKGKLQLNLSDGRNIITETKDYRTGDTLVLSLPEQEVRKHFRLEKGKPAILIGGKHRGQTGTVEDIQGTKIMYRDHEGNVAETLRKYAFVVGEDRPEVTVVKKKE